jgi:HD-GYP domain-containing protein (c-di-GMP phosphodiesterase class II)
MAQMEEPPVQDSAQEAASESPHYLRAVTELGEQQEIVAQEDIYAANGMKLLAKGARVNRKQFDKLVQHKLNASLDHSLELERAIDAKELAMEAARLLEHDPSMVGLAGRAGDPLAIKHELGSLALPKPLPMRLTVMRSQRPELFRHSLRTAVIALAMARRLKLPASETSAVALAALCHDLGELHTDPALLDTAHQIAPDERRYVHVHPITGYVLLGEIKAIPANVTRAVLQHQERLDGSGYPHGLKGDAIAPLARLIAVADVAEAVIDRFEPHRVDMLLKVCQNRFDMEMVNALRDLMQAPQRVQPGGAIDESNPSQQLERLAKQLDAWFTLSKMLEGQTTPIEFLYERMSGIRRVILQAGFDPEDIPGMAAIAAEDAGVMAELRDMLDEVDWALRDLANEIERRSPSIDGLSKAALDGLVDQFRAGAE